MSLPTDIAEMTHDAVVAPAIVSDGASIAAGNSDTSKKKNEESLKDDLAKRDAAINQPLSGAWKDVRKSVSHFITNLRHHAIGATPAFLVNNSSNILGAAHVGTEVLMFKSSIPHKDLVHKPKGPIDYVTRAVMRVFEDSFSGSQRDIAEIKEAMKGKPVSGFIDHLRDTDAATARVVGTIKEQVFSEDVVQKHILDKMQKLNEEKILEHISNEPEYIAKQGQKLSKEEMLEHISKKMPKYIAKQGVELTKEDYAQKRLDLKLGNPWQTRSTLAGLVVWSLSALIPDKREDPEEVERMAVKRETNPLGYLGERLKQAVWFPEWGSHKRQMISLGIAASGVFSLLGSWRNNIKTDAGLVYKFNGGVFATSMFTLAASLPLLLATDDQKGFGGFGALMMGRLTTLPGTIKKKFKGDKIAATYYTTATAAFQAENFAQALVGGAEKLPDGTIVDHEEVKRNAHAEATKIRAVRKSSAKHVDSDAVPSMVVSNVSHDDMAMPDRVLQQQATSVK